ncbi:hypothetical protein CBR_g40792 [Chara braunii]|uniref:Uncharacterized protein n=1 Tax=Chara braunii TaxID=69332 RepID=A0A388LUP5_CHABU|nr:hypothetical protein CBR_g40792 [Chara braunii]|eukprot:GBG85979.1 hypothetical protein CBR_g40792 [Chara braunii]
MQRPRLSLDLLRFTTFFSTAAIHVAAEFRFARTCDRARVLAEVLAFLLLSPPGNNHVSVIVAFTGDLMTLHPSSHTGVLRQLRLWAQEVTTAWIQLLAQPSDWIESTGGIDLNQLCLSPAAPEVIIPELLPFSATNVPLSFRIKELDVSILDAGKWAEWWNAYVALSFCLLEVVFHWAEDEVPDDEVELLIIQAWRTDTEGELLGILFGKVRDGHLEPITSKVPVFLAQLLDDLPLDILSLCDERSTQAALTRTLVPHLLCSTCTELDGDNCYYPSSGHYLVIDVTDLTLWDPIIRRVEVEGEADREEVEEEREEGSEEEEENSGAESNDPDYHESEEGELGESESNELGGPNERSEEDEGAA